MSENEKNQNEKHIAEKEAEEKLGFTPPAFKIAEKIGDDFKNVIADYYRIVYTEDVIPLKYKYLMAIATGIIAEHKSKVMVDTKKALQFGATKEEILEVLKMCVWWNGTPTLVKIIPDIINYLDKKSE